MPQGAVGVEVGSKTGGSPGAAQAAPPAYKDSPAINPMETGYRIASPPFG